MNNIFQKNLSALLTKNPELALKLENYVASDIPQLVQEGGMYNFVYKNIHLHNRQNPLAEAKEIFLMAENKPDAIHFIFGLGLGYLFQVASANSLGTVILYEPDLNILKIAFTFVDFSNDILKSNVFIAHTFEEAGEYIHRKSNTKNTPLMLTTPSYRELYGNTFEELVLELQKMVGQFGLDLKYTKEKFFPLLNQTLDNLPQLVKEIPLAELKDVYKGKTAVVVSAGPTLDRNIETIKKYRNNIVLIVVGTAMKTIASHNITPDFLCIIESFDCSKQIAGIDLSEVNFVTEPFSHKNLRQFKFKNIYTHSSSNTPINHFWSKISGINIDEYLSKGTVSYTALNTARILGASKIVLVGQDLAYIEEQCYSKDSAYKDLECRYNQETKKWEITAKDFDNFCASLSNSSDLDSRRKAAERRLKDLNGALYYVKGINGDMIPTEAVYAAFVKPITEFTQIYNDREYINTSLVGAQIDGFENIPLEKALENSEKIETRDLKVSCDYNISEIVSRLKQEQTELNQALQKVTETRKIIKSMNNDIKRHRGAGANGVNVEVLKMLKKLSVAYLELSTKYTKENNLFDFITISERIDLDYEMKMTREFTFETVSNIVNKISKYCENAQKKGEQISQKIDKVIGELQ